MKKFFAISVCALALSACVDSDADAPVLSSILPPAEARIENETPRVPTDVAQTIGGLYAAPELERELASILARLRAASDKPSLHYSVTILNSASINAFALPDGQLFVTRGLLALANDEAEIASVLAHEMAHVESSHTIERMEEAQSAVLASKVVMNVLGDKKAAQAALVSGALSLANFSRKQELQADQIGIKMAARAGYDPYGASRFLQSLDRASGLEKLDVGKTANADADGGFFATHPGGPQRVAAAVLAARQWGARGIGLLNRDVYLAALEGLIYGDDPSQGLIRGTHFIHPYFGFAFTAPAGFKLENTHQAVLGLAADERALRFDKLAKSDAPLEAQLRASSAQDLKIDKPQQLVINGYEAVTAVGRSPGWTFRLVLIRKDGETYRFIFVNRKFDAKEDAGFLDAAKSFHRIQQEEAAQSQPLRLHIIEARGGEAPSSFAQSTVEDEHGFERFLVLNGFEGNETLPPGAKVKIAGSQ